LRRVSAGILFLPLISAFGQTGSTQSNALTLNTAIQEAISRNLDLAAERYNISIAEARQITARLRPNPVLTFQAQTLDLLGTGFNANNPAGPNQITAHTDFILERKAKREGRIEVAATERTLAQLGVKEVMRQVILNVQNAFVDVLQAKENVKVARDNARSLQGIVEINETKVRAGELAVVELDRSRVAALQYQTAVEQAQLQLEQAKLKLQLLIGRRQSEETFDVDGALREDDIAVTADEIRSLARARRPDLLSIEQNQARSRRDLNLQLAYGKVDYTVGTEYTRQWTNYGSGNSLGFSFSVPLPVYNKNQGEIARAQVSIQQADARLIAALASASTEIDAAFRQYTVSKRLLKNIENNLLARAKSVRETTEYSYRRGEASLVEFLDAQRAFNDAMQSYIDARAGYARSLYLLDAVSGSTVASAD
jgi:cobalt-zinc-cadmium efflux system outer membrane protein